MIGNETGCGYTGDRALRVSGRVTVRYCTVSKPRWPLHLQVYKVRYRTPESVAVLHAKPIPRISPSTRIGSRDRGSRNTARTARGRGHSRSLHHLARPARAAIRTRGPGIKLYHAPWHAAPAALRSWRLPWLFTLGTGAIDHRWTSTQLESRSRVETSQVTAGVADVVSSGEPTPMRRHEEEAGGSTAAARSASCGAAPYKIKSKRSHNVSPPLATPTASGAGLG